MSDIRFTDDQRRAVETVGRGVLVSAAAGSGKTAVLAERCAYLICDAPAPYRCNADELLVLTFTEAAAAEMRSRIVEALWGRLTAAPGDDWLREQLVLVESAHISTIHAFCLWLIRRWFTEVGLDPTATVLDEHEAALLRNEVLDGLFADLYQRPVLDEHRLGTIESGSDPRPTAHTASGDGRPDSLAARFTSLVDSYGLGYDREIFDFILRLQSFTASLPDPEAWLKQATRLVAQSGDLLILDWFGALRDELSAQIEHCTSLAAMLRNEHPVNAFHADRMNQYVVLLDCWLAEMPTIARDDPSEVTAATFERCEAVRRAIAEHEPEKAQAPSLPSDTPSEVRKRREATGKLWSKTKKALFSERLRSRFGLFSMEEWRQGLRSIEPHVGTLVAIVRVFDERYAARKRDLNVLDFSDLERFAYDLLRSPDMDRGPASDTARYLQRRFAHVLVDEFQDVNPLQQAILSAVSRELDPTVANNLFVVGDVKQSIYRFRLAEPRLFIERLSRAEQCQADIAAIPLQQNFRSVPNILNAVNLVFSQLMRSGLGEVVYDGQAELRAGRSFDPSMAGVPVEVHLLERRWRISTSNDSIPSRDDDEPVSEESSSPIAEGEYDRAADAPAGGSALLDPPIHWSAIEREAYLIGSKIREWIAAGRTLPGGQPLRYRDCAVLLRATKVNADQMASVLQGMGIPAFASISGSLFGAIEVREMLATLELLDNARQDIPLAAVMRGGILCRPFTDDELVTIRCHNRDASFHESVRQYAEGGAGAELRAHVHELLRRVEHYREKVRLRPLAEVLWKLYKQEGYLAYAGGLPNGVQRRANLLKLHDLARAFGSFRRQGLGRFLHFVHSLAENEQAVGAAPAIGEAEDVVRIMSIHQAKGLEFPVVFLAGLGTRFNLGDRRGRMIFERRSGIGLRVVDPDRLIEYPSVAHQLVAFDVEHNTRQEELRILYVAMTRARDQLVMIGSVDNAAKRLDDMRGGRYPVTRHAFVTARTPIDWLIPVLANAPTGAVRGFDKTAATGATGARQPVFTLHLHDTPEMSNWRIDEGFEPSSTIVRRAVACLRALPSDEPMGAHEEPVSDVLRRTEFVYPYLSVASVSSTVAAGSFKGAFDFTVSDAVIRSAVPGTAAEPFAVPLPKYGKQQPDIASERGTAMHRFLQHLDFARASNAEGVASEGGRLIEAGVLTDEERKLVDIGAIEWFVSTPLSEMIRSAGKAYRREFQYIASESPTLFDETVHPAGDDFVLVRGIVDGILLGTDGPEIVDFKTDRIAESEVAGRVEHYRRQLTLYARAVSRMWRKPVRKMHLVFLHPRVVASIHHSELFGGVHSTRRQG